MLCTTCGVRPVADAAGRCTRCTALHRAAPGGLMRPTAVPPPETWHRLRSPVGLSKAVVALLSAVVVTDLLAVAAGLNLRGVIGDGVTDGFLNFGGESEALRADLLYSRAGSLQMLALLGTAVLFVIWFHRVRQNAEVFDASQQPMKAGWAIGSWFVPFGNFWLPRRIAGGIWTASARPAPDGGRGSVSKATLNAWWTAWVVSLLFSRYASRQYVASEEPQEVMDAAGLVIVGDVLDLLAAVLAIVFVRSLTRMQGERAALGPHPLMERPATGPVPS
ncbi:DUF4328 domain-containing protein [Streptomyces sp. B1I3]|uniref:DUF4328 domain-containing protein n=1 Tax=Streptomyces sp. B1I3 TaxID=3042264 RepID=UPI00278323B4|nr:DUF4328 domain-containing protein [Streptomyces sp. B1I3]MDQ0794414.1 hypothetical protein [Streptomyces sp. B1I3]